MTGWANGVLLDSNSDMANKFNMAMGGKTFKLA